MIIIKFKLSLLQPGRCVFTYLLLRHPRHPRQATDSKALFVATGLRHVATKLARQGRANMAVVGLLAEHLNPRPTF